MAVNGYDPDLFDAVEFGDLGSVKMYMKQKIDINYQETRFGWDLIMLASYFGHVEIIKFLLKFNPDLSKKDNKGMSALDIARKQKHVDVVETLKQHFKNNS